ncbi:hypothetical protein LY71_10628 [Geodermatophilus tzadiensis]|uniref:ABC-2 family transporter n=1 Tax=Geodermatophilus tzadiensis TaxID=1137988 RepID=A0A2T0TU77_9ACTN|nr:ABC transporter permease [Geodermatophilus tzadiensis]PRY49254.1 hypothetical protein LY71_10628 [Geodermatophilus tzadiensis]
MPGGLAPPPGPADQTAEEERSAGSPAKAGLRGIVLPAVVAVLVGCLYLAVQLSVSTTSTPRDLPVGVVGSAEQVDRVRAQVEQAQPGALRLVALPDAAAAEQAVRRDEVRGALVLDGPAPQLLTAGAHGQGVTETLTGAFTPVAQQAGQQLAVTDVAPLVAQDARGRALDHTAFAVVLGGFLFGITSYQVAPQLALRLRLASSGLFAVAAGATGALLSRAVFDAVPGSAWTIGGLVALLALASGAFAALTLRLLGGVGTFAATAVLLILGAATSTGSDPAEYLPGWAAPLASVLPSGVAVQGLRDAVYFTGGGALRAVVVLALWAGVPFLVIAVLDAVTRRRG